MKQQLRKETLAKRNTLSSDERACKSLMIKSRVTSLPAFTQAQAIMAYMDFRGEVETTGLLEAALSEGKRVVVPRCNPDRTITPLEIKDLQQDLQTGTWGIREPDLEKCRPVDPLEIDLVLVPGVAFDPEGNRLGYGAGYYDRFIPRLRPGVPLAALAYEIQILPAIQPDPHDRPMNMVITEDRIILVDKT